MKAIFCTAGLSFDVQELRPQVASLKQQLEEQNPKDCKTGVQPKRNQSTSPQLPNALVVPTVMEFSSPMIAPMIFSRLGLDISGGVGFKRVPFGKSLTWRECLPVHRPTCDGPRCGDQEALSEHLRLQEVLQGGGRRSLKGTEGFHGSKRFSDLVGPFWGTAYGIV